MKEPEALIAIQEADLGILRAKKRLDSLPEREQILAVRAKRTEVKSKADQVAALKASCQSEINRFQDEDTSLLAKTADAQAKLDGNSDYRSISSITKEIEGFAKRREKIEFELMGLLERMEKISTLDDQVSDALAKLDKQEESLVAKYRANGSVIQQEISLSTHAREEAAAVLAPELLAQYEKLRASKNGIGAGSIQDKHCSVCRVEFHDGQLSKLLHGPDISTCPNCHRLIVVRGA